MLNKLLLPWLLNDVIKKMQQFQNVTIFSEQEDNF